MATVLLLAACRPSLDEVNVPPPPREPRTVVLDTDIGTDVDDTWALAQLLRSPGLDLRMVLTDTADTVYRARLAAKFLEVAGRTDVAVGVGQRGAPSQEFQRPWVGDYTLADYPGTVHEDGIGALIELVHASPTPITIIAIGAVPNLAEALRRDPTIAPKVDFIGMHGSIDRGYGDAPSAEANVKSDVPAFRAVLAAPWRSIAITPLDTCGRVVLTGEHYQRLRQSEDPMLRALFENYTVWSGLVTWMQVDFLETRSSTLFDTVAVYMAGDDPLLRYEVIPLTVTDDGFTRRDPEHGRPVRVALAWHDLEAYETHLARRLLGEE